MLHNWTWPQWEAHYNMITITQKKICIRAVDCRAQSLRRSGLTFVNLGCLSKSKFSYTATNITCFWWAILLLYVFQRLKERWTCTFLIFRRLSVLDLGKIECGKENKKQWMWFKKTKLTDSYLAVSLPNSRLNPILWFVRIFFKGLSSPFLVYYETNTNGSLVN